MDTLPCGHAAPPSPHRLCPHLPPPEDVDLEYVRKLTGRGIEYDLVCVQCDRSENEPELHQACEDCYADNDESNMIAWRGNPEIKERPEPVDPTLTRTALPRDLHDALDWCALPGTDQSTWLFFTPHYQLVGFNADNGRHDVLATARLPRDTATVPEHITIPRPHRPHLHVSPSGHHAAIVNDFGSRGIVVDLNTGWTTMLLDGAGETAHTVTFALAFAEYQGHDVVVHRTFGNRLDVSDPITGELLTARQTHLGAHEGEPHPEHYLLFGHGVLQVSPDGRWIADTGRSSGPWDATAVWDLHRWLDENPWESEDGPTRRVLCSRENALNVPACWISPTSLAVAGVGNDGDLLLDGVRIFDAPTGTELRVFPGPGRQALFADAHRLYSVNDDGLEIWDPSTGERTGAVPGFHPSHHHPGAAELAAIDSGDLLRWAPPDNP